MKPSQFVTLLFIPAIITGCTRFYAPTTSNLPHADAIKKAKSESRYFILHDSLFTYALTNVEVDEEKNNIITCDVHTISPEHKVYLNAKNKHYSYKRSKGQGVVLNEVHIFSSRLTTRGSGRAEIPLLAVNRVEEINYDKHRTKKQHTRIWLIAGGVFVIGVIAGAVAVAGSMPAYY